MKVTAQVANFNIVFGDDEQPMLEYFDSVIYPAFKSGIVKKSNDDVFIIRDIEVTENKQGDAILVGKIIKKTTVDVLSDLDVDNNLIEKDDHYTSAPYSTFVIYLRNHRVFYVPNQKGSPSLVNFRTTIAFVIKDFISKYNQSNENKIPFAIVKIVGIPSARTMNEMLASVKKINSLTLKFYPLNGAIDYSDTFEIMSKDLRKKVGSKTGKIVLNSPQSVSGVVDVLQQAEGTIDPVVDATTYENSHIRIQDDQMTEKYEMVFDNNLSLDQKQKEIINKADEISAMKQTNENHNEIYERNKDKIIRLYNKAGRN